MSQGRQKLQGRELNNDQMHRLAKNQVYKELSKSTKRIIPSPWAAQLVRALAQYASVAGLIPIQGACKSQP